MKLYSYFRSSAAYRVRIALHLKDLDYDTIPVHLLKAGGEQKKPGYLAKNPQGLVPSLETEQGIVTESLAILDWLETNYPEPALLPQDSFERAFSFSVASEIACNIHPLNNLRVLQHLKASFDWSEEQKKDWIVHWISQGFEALEQKLAMSPRPGWYALGDTPTWADIFLIPQVYSALRFAVPLQPFPRILAIYDMAMAQPAFMRASPEAQPDAEF